MKSRELMGRMRKPKPSPPKSKRKRDPNRPICGAKKKSGGFCALPPLKGKKRCKLHGGRLEGNKKQTSEQAHKNSVVHGIYADTFLLDGEYEVYPNVVGTVGTLDQEIHANRMMLRRTLNYQSKMDAVRDQLAAASHDINEFIRVALSHKLITVKEIEQHKDQVVMGTGDDRVIEEIAKNRMIRKLTDYNEDIRKYTRTVKKLEQARRDLLETEDWGEDFVRRLAEDLRKFGDNADKTIQQNFGSGNYQDLQITVTQ